MKKLTLALTFCLLLLAGFANAADTVTITDMGGRSVTVPSPADLERVATNGPPGFIIAYTLAPDLLVGTPFNTSDAAKQYLDEHARNLPNLGGMQSGAQLNMEAILSARPQVILSLGFVAPSATDISLADELQAQLGIPVICLDGTMEHIAELYTFLGALFGREEKARELADYCTAVFEDVVAKVAQIPEDQRVRVYYAEQGEGLNTEPESSSHAQALRLAGAHNVAVVESGGGGGMSPVSLEQVLNWNPDVIFSWHDSAGGPYSMIHSNPDWSTITAVQNGRIYANPTLPFNWMDRPPAVNRFLGIQWIANLLYPEIYDVDIVKVAVDFYAKFYHVQVSEDEMRNVILHDSLPK